MKYKNRLIIPTLLSTSLIASSMVASADEMETEEQSFEENLQVQYSDEENTDQEAEKDEDSSVAEDEELKDSEEDKTKDNTEPESENTDKITEDEVTSEESIEEGIPEEENTEIETEQDVSVEEETVSESPDQAEQDLPVEEATEELEEVDAEENNNSEVVVEESEQEVTAEENAGTEDAEQFVNEESATSEVEISENNSTEAVTEEVEQEVPRVEEEVAEDAETEANTTSEVEASENNSTETVTEEVEQEVPRVEESSNKVEENVTEEDSSSEVQEEVENSSTDETKEATKQENTSEETNQVNEATEVNEKESENDTDKVGEEESETATYKYDSETLASELENKSASERAQFLEENADDIEADEALLSELSEAVEAEHGIEIDENQVFSTFSTMSMSQAITDINSYIDQQNFEVAEIQYDIIDHLPLYAYESNIGWNPENGKVGQPSGVVLHDVGNDNSTIYGEIEYMSKNWENAFVHAFVDADNIIQVANTDYLAYGAGPVSNEIHLQVELVRHDNQHDFARSINNYADYVANLLYKYKLPAERADSSGNGTLWSHVEVSNILGGTASPDPYEYFQTHGYAYEDLISLIQGRYNNLYNKVTTPSIYMPTFEGDTSNLAGNITNQNRGIYESITDVRTSDASNYLDQEFRIVRSEIYNYEEYYLLESIEDGSTIGWMYAGDVYTSALDEKPVEQPEKEKPEEETPAEENKPEAPEKDDDLEETEDEKPVEQPKPEEPKEDSDSEKIEDEKPAEEAKPETPEKDTDSDDTNEPSKETSDDVDEDTSSEDSSEKPEQEASGEDASKESDDDTDQSSEKPEMEESKDNAESEKDDTEKDKETSDAKADKDESNDSDGDNKSETGNVSSLVDSATGVKVYSATEELLGKSLAVTVLNPSNAINAPHDLYDIHILNSDGSLYDLKNPVTVYLPANGYVSNLYYLGDIGETLEAVSYRTEGDYVVFDVSGFSQYAVVYGESTEENTVVPPTTDDNSGNDDSMSGENNHSKVYTEAVDDTAEVAAVETQDEQSTPDNEEEAEVLPNTGVAEQSTTILATVLAALGLGFLVRRKKVKEDK